MLLGFLRAERSTGPLAPCLYRIIEQLVLAMPPAASPNYSAGGRERRVAGCDAVARMDHYRHERRAERGVPDADARAASLGQMASRRPTGAAEAEVPSARR